ncbi:alpha/beta fold hydrolase [Rhizobacter sp. Root1221]|uniref:alpha/beta fold hydrolase n=1 Tax=Rhizobacter sp. Root1221 TaxID=1736433 RepID=UPI0006FC0C64|nr:alpha/beta hydrolase [Rhizobacter sp. Root1221]KQV85510.1 hypothetical protein ASC87_07430 [Rhizobacter sp. Root1221]
MTTLVLLPGMDGTGIAFRPFLAALDPALKVVVVSYPPDRALGYDALLAVARQALPADDDVVVLGESFSGPIAIALAAEGLPRLRGLVLCATFARNPRPRAAVLGRIMAHVPMPLTALPGLSRVLLGRFDSPALRRLLAESLASVSPAVMRFRARAVMAVDMSDRLRAVTVPTLYLRGREDRVVPAAAALWVQAQAPHTSMAPFDGPHGLLQSLPFETAGVIEAFVAGC